MDSCILENLLRIVALPKCSEYQVIAKDEISDLTFSSYPMLVVLNTGSRATTSGIHWIPLFFTKRETKSSLKYAIP